MTETAGLDEILVAFVEDAHELAGKLEDGLLGLETGGGDAATLNAVFRAAHTIKGDAGIVELHVIERFTHALENSLDDLRAGRSTADGELVSTLLTACDHIKTMLARVARGLPESDAELDVRAAEIVQRLRGEAGAVAVVVPAARPENRGAGWHLTLRCGTDLLRRRMDPLDMLRYLKSVGEVVHLATHLERLPDVLGYDPEACYLDFTVDIRGVDRDVVESAFALAGDAIELTVEPLDEAIGERIDAIADLPEQSMRLGEMLVRGEALTPEELAAGLELLKETEAAHAGTTQLGAVLVDRQWVAPEVVEAAAARQREIGERAAFEASLVRVPSGKLDQLVDMVGELVIASAAAGMQARQSGQGGLIEANAGVSRLVEGIRELSLKLRMVRVGETFNRFRRVVRDMARDMEREVELVLTGEDTEIDKSVIDKIGDPLTHLIRNALDHGIEPAAVRQALGKPASGRLELAARHENGGIVIEVSDDGAGLNVEKIRAKAIERGLIDADDVLDERQIVDLVFAAGFSTADKITNVSGRGVGMDVVRSSVQALRGTVELDSMPGGGTRCTIRLPLTMAIIDGFLVASGNAHYVVPLDSVAECSALSPGAAGAGYLDLRGEVLPCLRLRDTFASGGEPPLRENVVVVRRGDCRVGLVVDALLGEFQTVIKPLSPLFRALRGIAGTTIMGNGEVALILDVPALAGRAAARAANRAA